jgi:hypothetical protein
METLSSHLGIKNVDTPYGLLHTKATNPAKWAIAVREITKMTHRNLKDDFILKVETTEMFTNGEYIGLETFMPTLYDKIYVIKRNNLADIFCSLYTVEQSDVWHYRDNEIPMEFEPVFIDVSKHADLIKKVKLVNHSYMRAMDYLNRLSIAYEELEYSDICTWINEHAPTGTTNLVNPHYDYSKIFTNYGDLTKLLNE